MTTYPLAYKGYSGRIIACVESGFLYGRVLFIKDLIMYEGKTVPEIVDSFNTCIDEYLEYCDKRGKPANKPIMPVSLDG